MGLREDGLPDIVWIEIPQGRIQLKGVAHNFDVKPFRLAKYPVTNTQFEAFIDAEDGYRNSEWWYGIKQSETPLPPEWKEANCPRETVSWFEVVAFCRWLSHRTGSTMRLPTEWEWQQAATGGDPTYDYPWSGGWDATRCNSSVCRLGRTTPVGIYPRGATRHGLMDMAGNVWEWCLNKYHKPWLSEAQGIDDTFAIRVYRGGSWANTPGTLRSSDRGKGEIDAGEQNRLYRLSSCPRTSPNPLPFILLSFEMGFIFSVISDVRYRGSVRKTKMDSR